jgi:hypothetical protein
LFAALRNKEIENVCETKITRVPVRLIRVHVRVSFPGFGFGFWQAFGAPRATIPRAPTQATPGARPALGAVRHHLPGAPRSRAAQPWRRWASSTTMEMGPIRTECAVVCTH